MKSFFKNVLSTIVGMVLAVFVIMLLFIGIVSVSISSLNNEPEVTVKENSILKINLSDVSVVERISENPFEGLNFSGDIPKTIALKQVLDNIEKAKADEQIKAIYINTSFVNAGLSQIEEIRNKLLEFKQTGKPIIAYAEVYSQTAYYLSSVANKIYLNPEGIVELKGLSAGIMFYKEFLKKLDIDVQVIRHGKFKSAIEPYILDKMSAANREQMQLLLNSFADNIMDSIANQRGLTLAHVESHINNLSLEDAKKCLELTYVDALLYQDQIEDSLIKIAGSEKLNLISLGKYTHTKSEKKEISRDKIAIIYATGAINSGEGNEKSIGSTTTSAAIKQAREDKRVKAIVLRVNSPGGSALASDVIWRETILAKAEKPLVVSMGDYAASGGYYIACAADSIVANPTTLTGSIGVFGLIPNLSKFYKNKLGISIDTVNTGKYADMGVNRPLSNFEKNKIQNSIKNIYTTFITHVGEGRGMSTTAVDEIGQGRVWTGYDAKEIGLIDTYGGVEKAIDIAAYLAKIEDYRVISLPKKKDPFTELALKLGNSSSFSDILFTKLGLKTELTQPIESLLKGDKIQARIPFIMKLK
ncbi:MAG: signal peptide peptidase SppA [Flavobacteriales bacterium]|jgi:protease IV|nr:signal peptide peptidase SppA [Flavobacteriales bacterium]MBT4882214.1 signal peptide peptidase SppA [Flavobacteriales bacterium]MDG1348807.1 signal peptide peptidase SppA [Flavobacteriales bacterium]